MHRFKNIGVVLNLDHSNQNALRRAKELTDTNNATIHLLCLIANTFDDKQKSRIETYLKKTINFPFSLTFISSKPIIGITHYVAEHNLNMILIEPDENKNIINQFFKGPLTLALMRKTPCTIWVVKKSADTAYARIMIAIDPEEENSAESDLNDKLIQVGTSYAKHQSAECHLVTAWTLEGQSMLEGPFIKTPKDEMDTLRDNRKGEFARALEVVEKRNKAIMHDCETHMINGHPGDAIATFAREKDIDLIVMGTLSRTGIQGFFIGNTAESIINQVDCSIMAIKPEGFVSPILS